MFSNLGLGNLNDLDCLFPIGYISDWKGLMQFSAQSYSISWADSDAEYSATRKRLYGFPYQSGVEFTNWQN
ncbi:hypothetical protein MC7420_2452 [Coleofasciculus chthonoplastes PCC 7420]|uniref:Uncharacterized protein n=1 Tax=Coleofasciculus chthonoplastes PCC 7420 TaxID=118168 RepID=B4VZT9_9CYAN|nr:hypothetical protein [Coleofasciculus chthonoplastes]EDX72544.1 hypothetical protein MC7420_2452 [Coleofasciculus chthonoplastes PCC 7420]